MARRALTEMVSPSSPSDKSSPSAGREGTAEADAVVDAKELSGSTVTLNEKGYSEASECCCPLEMTMFIKRIITNEGFVVCDEGSLQGLVAWYYCKNQTRSFAELSDEVSKGPDGDCPWLGTESACPKRSINCPSFPVDNTAHRRRTCAKRHLVESTTRPPEATTYLIEKKTHCGYYKDCGKDSNVLHIGDAGSDYTNTSNPSEDCTSVCDSSPLCRGFTYIKGACLYRRNVTCGVFDKDSSECWVKTAE
jgi:hypothetical protein